MVQIPKPRMCASCKENPPRDSHPNTVLCADCRLDADKLMAKSERPNGDVVIIGGIDASWGLRWAQ